MEFFKTDTEAYIPKKVNRWKVSFPKDFNIPEWVVTSVSAIRFDAKKKNWDDIIIKMCDPFNVSTSKRMVDVLSEGRYHNFVMELHFLNEVGETLETFTIGGCNLCDVNFGEFNYNTSDLKDVTLTISFNKLSIDENT
jgi:hypothetical protein